MQPLIRLRPRSTAALVGPSRVAAEGRAPQPMPAITAAEFMAEDGHVAPANPTTAPVVATACAIREVAKPEAKT
jgi:hypothetical protein